MAQPQQSHYGRLGQQPYYGAGGVPPNFPPRNFYSPQPGEPAIPQWPSHDV
jgi:hypothetical protein